MKISRSRLTAPWSLLFAGVSSIALQAVLLSLPTIPAHSEVMLIDLLLIGGIAALFDLPAALLSIAICSAALVYYFLEPVYSFTMHSSRDFALLFTFLLVAAISCIQTLSIRSRERQARENAEKAELLASVSLELSQSVFGPEVASDLLGYVTRSSGASGLYVVRRLPDDSLETRLPEPDESVLPDPVRAEIESGLREWDEQTAAAHASTAGLQPIEVADGSLILPLKSLERVDGVMYLEPRPDGDSFTPEDLEQVWPITAMLGVRYEGMRAAELAATRKAYRNNEQLRTTLVSAVSHELKTPIAAAKATIGGLMHEPEKLDTEEAQAKLRLAMQGLDRLQAMVGGLLDVTLLDSKEWRMNMESCEVGDLLGTGLSRIPLEQSRRVEVEIADESPCVSGDAEQLIRLMMTVIGNALAYSDEGTPICVRVRIVLDRVLIAVSDTGPGIAENEREAVFERLVRGSSARDTVGTGLGLAIAREIARLHNGDVVLDDDYEGGARFVIDLPRCGSGGGVSGG